MDTDPDRELSRAIKSQASYHAAPPGLGGRILAAIEEAEGRSAVPPARAPSSRWWPWLQTGLAFACGVLVSFAVLRLEGSADQTDRLAREVVASHVRSLMVDHLADVDSTDQHTVKPWFSGKLDFSPPVTDLSASGFPLVGGRLDYLAQHPVAALIYMHDKHTINLFAWPAGDGSPEGMKTLSQQGFNLVAWHDSGMELWAVSDLNAEELRAFATALSRKIGS